MGVMTVETVSKKGGGEADEPAATALPCKVP